MSDSNDMVVRQKRTTTMKSTLHTPGPWLVDFESDEFDSKQSRLRIIDGSEASLIHPQGPLTIANLNVCAFAPHMDEPLANARLMASAPELLAALELGLRNIEDIESNDVLNEHERAFAEAARAAIARAKGNL